MSWARILGHDRQRARFVQADRLGRLGHAYLFAGPAGIGKRLFASELAKAILCDARGETLAACDRCASCKLVEARTHPDVVFAAKPDDKLEFPLETMKALCANLALKPVHGSRRIAIVEDAEYFNEESANCFLKTLEEPPAGAILILLATDAERQLPTIRSRCQTVTFGPINDAEVEAVLKRGGSLPDAAICAVARIARGSPGRALELFEADLAGFPQRLLAELTKAKPDGVSLAKLSMEQIEAAGKESAQQRRRARLIIQLLVDAFQDALRIALGQKTTADGGVAIETLAQRFGVDGIVDRLERLMDAEAHSDRRVQLVLLIEAMCDALTLEAPVQLRAERI